MSLKSFWLPWFFAKQKCLYSRVIPRAWLKSKMLVLQSHCLLLWICFCAEQCAWRGFKIFADFVGFCVNGSTFLGKYGQRPSHLWKHFYNKAFEVYIGQNNIKIEFGTHFLHKIVNLIVMVTGYVSLKISWGSRWRRRMEGRERRRATWKREQCRKCFARK